MSLKEELKAEAAIEKKKLKEMSLNDKIWYIWEYYKFHIAGVLLVLLLLGVIGTSIYNSTLETVLYSVIINNRSVEEISYEPFEVDFREYMGFTDKQKIYNESLFISYDDTTASEYSYASMMKITALIAANDLDIIISDQEAFDHHAQMDAYMDLETALPADMWEALKDRAIYTTTESGETIAGAIDISKTAFAEKCGIVLEPAYCGIIVNTERTDTCIALLRYIFDLDA